MKDKRQRIAVAWPYAAVYADPAFAASLLQAAANSVSMPYYASPMIPQMPVIAPSQIPTANHYSYNYRYAPYHQMAQRNPAGIPPPSHSSPISTPPDGPFTRADLMNGHNTSFCSEYLQSPSSPLSPLSLSPISDSDKVNSKYALHFLYTFVCLNSKQLPISFIHFQFQILPIQNIQNTQSAIIHQINQQNNNNNNNVGETTITKTDKPKLFKPYKSEE